jgi:hypothetical protein
MDICKAHQDYSNLRNYTNKKKIIYLEIRMKKKETIDINFDSTKRFFFELQW